MNRQRLLLFLVLLTACANVAAAVPRNWVLSGVTFADGGTASGSFTFDAATSTYSNINVTTTTGSVRSGAVYHFVSGGLTPSNVQVLVATIGSGDPTGTPALAFFFGGAGLAGSSPVSIVDGQEANCSNSSCSTPTAPSRFVTGGSAIQISTVPAVSTAAALLTAALLAGAVLLSLRRAARGEV